jgi:hypothetical protein
MTLSHLLISSKQLGRTSGMARTIGKSALVISDLTALAYAALVANLLHSLRPGLESPDFFGLWTSQIAQDRLEILGTLVLIALLWFWMLGHYSRRRPAWDEIAEVTRVVVLLAAIDASLM